MGSEDQRGFSLLEVLVASVLLAIAVIGTGFLFVSGEVGVAEKGYGRGTLHAARSRIETLQRLGYHHSDLSLGTHSDPGNPITVDDRGTAATTDDLRGYCRWVVVDVDDPADGSGEADPDYKDVRVQVAEDSGFTTVWTELRTYIGP